MAHIIRNIDGIESGDKFRAINDSNAAYNASYAKDSEFGVRLNRTGNYHRYVAAVSLLNTGGVAGNVYNKIWGTYHFKLISAIGSGEMPVCEVLDRNDWGFNGVQFALNSSRKLCIRELTGGSEQTLHTSTGTALSTGTWYLISVYVNTTLSTDAYRIIVRDAGTGVTIDDYKANRSSLTVDTLLGYFHLGGFYATDTGGEAYYDNFVCEADATLSNIDDPYNLIKTTSTIRPLDVVSGACTYDTYSIVGGSPPKYQHVDNRPVVVAQPHLYGNALNEAQTFPVETFAAAGISTSIQIMAVAAVAIVTGAAGAGMSTLRLRSGSTDSDASAYQGTEKSTTKIHTTDPNTAGGGWSKAAVEACQIGAAHLGDGGGWASLFECWLDVLYKPAVAGDQIIWIM